MAYIELDVLNNTPKPVIGIDLGTTNSMAAVWLDGRPQVLRPEGQSPIVPSAWYFAPTGELLVGRPAREHASSDPGRALFSIKRFMGRGRSDVEADLETVPFPVTEGENGVLAFQVDGRAWTPQELSARLLATIADRAAGVLDGVRPERAVITVPAYFDDTQRQATRDAARLAGLEVLRIINEPTAASLAYGLDQREAGTIAVYDLGGGTFDVSILTIEEGVFRVLATSGDTHLGGDDFDRALMNLALAEIGDRLGDGAKDPALLQSLRIAAERCKMELSTRPEADLVLSAPEYGVHWRRSVRRQEFEAAIAPLIERTTDACLRAMADAGLDNAAIDEVVLVGGSTRVPAVVDRVRAFFGREPHNQLDPDQVVALGAAVQAHVLGGGTREVLLLDVTPLSLGLETMGGAVARLIERNSPIPCQATEGFTTYADNQTGITFNIVQGERELAADCRSLGRFELTGFPPMPAGMARIAVRFQIDADGILTVSAKEDSTGVAASCSIQPMNGLTDSEVEQMLAEGFARAQEDFDARRVADLKVEIGTMLRATRAHLDDVRAELDPEAMAEIEEAAQHAETLAAEERPDGKSIQISRDRLEQATLPLAALLMDRVAKQALAGKRLSDV
jgi:molecular chaperone DnaK